MPDPIRVGTRGSRLALAQTQIAVDALARAASAAGVDAAFEVVTIRTAGDRESDKPFKEVGPKGVFATELQRALLDGAIDLAVHSLKDLTAQEPDGLTILAVPAREDVRDVVISRTGEGLSRLAPGSTVGTSAARRAVLVAIARPDLRVVGLRGNVDTRLDKVARGDVDAAILAAAGLIRLGRDAEVSEWLDPALHPPAPGQGALAIEAADGRARSDLAWVSGVQDPLSRAAVDAERAFTVVMEGSCDLPLGAWARHEDGVLVLDAFVSAPDGSDVRRGSMRGEGDPATLGSQLAARLLRS